MLARALAVAALSLGGHAAASVTPVILGYQPEVQSRFAPADAIGALNPDFALHGVTGLGYFDNDIGNSSVTAAISPDYVLGAFHWRRNLTGKDIIFYDASGTPHARRVVNITTVTGADGSQSDLVLGRLDEPLPPEISPLPIAERVNEGQRAIGFTSQWAAGSIVTRRPFPASADPKFIPWQRADADGGLTTAITGDSGSVCLAPAAHAPEGWCVMGIHTYTTMMTSATYCLDDILAVEPLAEVVTPLTDLTADAESNILDVLEYVAWWGESNPEADWTRDGQPNVSDVLAFVTSFNSGQ